MTDTEDTIQFTPTEHLLLKVTADGLGHKPEELLACLDEMADRNNLRFHLSNLRAKLIPMGQDIVAQSFGTYIKYRRVRFLCHLSTGT